MTTTSLRCLLGGLLGLVLLLVLTPDLWGQEMSNLPASTMGSQSLRPYWHVFIAYAIAIGLMFVWIVKIARGLARLESRISEG